jgi:hypothetical protein
MGMGAVQKGHFVKNFKPSLFCAKLSRKGNFFVFYLLHNQKQKKQKKYGKASLKVNQTYKQQQTF